MTAFLLTFVLFVAGIAGLALGLSARHGYRCGRCGGQDGSCGDD